MKARGERSVTDPAGPAGAAGTVAGIVAGTVAGTASDQERAHARERFRTRLADAQRRATPEKRAKLRAALGFTAPAA